MKLQRILLIFLSAAALVATGASTGQAAGVWKPVLDSNVGGTVVSRLRGKPLVIRVHAAWCAECQTTLPDYLTFTKTFHDKINTLDIDVTDGKTSAAAEALAKSAGLGAYYERTKTEPLTVAFVDPNSNSVVAELRGNVDFNDLVRAEKTVERRLPRRQ
jgi:hypothetical protein